MSDRDAVTILKKADRAQSHYVGEGINSRKWRAPIIRGVLRFEKTSVIPIRQLAHCQTGQFSNLICAKGGDDLIVVSHVALLSARNRPFVGTSKYDIIPTSSGKLTAFVGVRAKRSPHQKRFARARQRRRTSLGCFAA
jgi:hypothetical protein